MGERKVLIRYVPPDFDPSIIPKFKRDKTRPVEVRMMLPFSMRCLTCGEYLGRGKKFNSEKEICRGEDYMGIKKIRFIIKCSVCSAEISFKTDPKNSDYECEYGAKRNFEVWKENESIKKEEEKLREEEDIDAMKSLENRTYDSKHEMEVLDALDEIKAMNQRHERVDIEEILNKRIKEDEEQRKLLLEATSTDIESLYKAAKNELKNNVNGNNNEEDDDNFNLLSFSSVSNVNTTTTPINESNNNNTNNNTNNNKGDIRTELVKQLKAKDLVDPKKTITVIKKKRKITENSSESKSSEQNNSKNTTLIRETKTAFREN